MTIYLIDKIIELILPVLLAALSLGIVDQDLYEKVKKDLELTKSQIVILNLKMNII